MRQVTISSIDDYLGALSKRAKNEIVLLRGQSDSYELIPRIARKNPTVNSENRERKMLAELRRWGSLYIDRNLSTDWDVMIYAQHFGMATRLLDWTLNPLIALYFACVNREPSYDSYVYIFIPSEKDMLDIRNDPDPFSITSTKILRANFNNRRIVAQNGWFTAHPFSISSQRFVALEKNKALKNKVVNIQIPGVMKDKLITSLDVLGVNAHSVFPDIEGLCKYINWMFD